MKIAATFVCFQFDGDEHDDIRSATHAAEISVQEQFDIDPANILVTRVSRSTIGVEHGWEVDVLLPLPKED